MQDCVCGWTGIRIESHYRASSVCREPHEARKQQKVAPAPSVERSNIAETTFTNNLHSSMGAAMMKGHKDLFIKMAHLDHIRCMVTETVKMALEFVAAETASGLPPEERERVASLFSFVRNAFDALPCSATLIERAQRPFLRADPLVLSTPSPMSDKGGACFFSLIQLTTIMLQESKYVRQQAIKASDDWKSGVLYNVFPATVSDVTEAKRFRSKAKYVGKATEEEKNDLRVIFQVWTDAFNPVDGLGQKARKRKYEALLAALLNLPLATRHYADFILLLALWASHYAKQNGGMVRMLTGIGMDGKDYKDGMNVAAELELPADDCQIIKLKNDDDPNGEPLEFRLRLYVAIACFDWLAGGDFGPFAATVSARRPCQRCFWTAGCACAHMSARDPRRATMIHSAECRELEPRTHSGTMEVVREMRNWQGSAANLAALRTQEGIFSIHFSSEKILDDLVKDCCPDIMHLYLCGMSRYLLSWVTDILIPQYFTWKTLNVPKCAYPFGREQKVPDLERTLGSNRGSCSIHLTAGETMDFTLARCEIPNHRNT